ncbi:HNH endonuclease [Streptomyces sp. NPDC102384]|uniref:HNH endonuclease n=1 Tax=Streptomyces sp. NPDC102384 TaxID=3366166 RepID=UPI0038252A20
MARRRRAFRVWEQLCVLTANNGCCIYCGGPSEEMDHVIPFSDGGADALSNLVPACRDCNRKKGGRTPADWYISMDLRLRWGGKGTPQKGAIYKDSSLRDLYLSIHEEVLTLLDDLDAVAAEIADQRRWSWFLWSCSWNYPRGWLDVGFYRTLSMEKIEAAKAAGWPDARPTHLRDA